jgi:hypothetical protein
MDPKQAIKALLQHLQRASQEEEEKFELLLLDGDSQMALLKSGRRKKQIEKYISVLHQLQEDWDTYQAHGEWPVW